MEKRLLERIAARALLRRRNEIDTVIFAFLIEEFSDSEMVARIRSIRSRETDLLLAEDLLGEGTKPKETCESGSQS